MVLDLATIVAGVKSSLPALAKTGEVLGQILQNQQSQDPALKGAQAKLEDGSSFALCLAAHAPKNSLILALEECAAKIQETEEAKGHYDAWAWSGVGNFHKGSQYMVGGFTADLQTKSENISKEMQLLQSYSRDPREVAAEIEAHTSCQSAVSPSGSTVPGESSLQAEVNIVTTNGELDATMLGASSIIVQTEQVPSLEVVQRRYLDGGNDVRFRFICKVCNTPYTCYHCSGDKYYDVYSGGKRDYDHYWRAGFKTFYHRYCEKCEKSGHGTYTNDGGIYITIGGGKEQCKQCLGWEFAKELV